MPKHLSTKYTAPQKIFHKFNFNDKNVNWGKIMHSLQYIENYFKVTKHQKNDRKKLTKEAVHTCTEHKTLPLENRRKKYTNGKYWKA